MIELNVFNDLTLRFHLRIFFMSRLVIDHEWLFFGTRLRLLIP